MHNFCQLVLQCSHGEVVGRFYSIYMQLSFMIAVVKNMKIGQQ